MRTGRDDKNLSERGVSSIKKGHAGSMRSGFASFSSEGAGASSGALGSSRARRSADERERSSGLRRNEAPIDGLSENAATEMAWTRSGGQKQKKQQRRREKDTKLLAKDRWYARDGHALTYAAVFLFTLTLYFRPYELVPGLSAFSSIALVIGLATLLIYLPSQFSLEGSLTFFSTEVKCILFIAVWALLTIPIAKDPALAWSTFVDPFIKTVVIFVVMLNCVRTKKRLTGLMWLGVAAGTMLSLQAINLYQKGEFKTEGYRVSVDFGGMFANPNDMAVHFVMFAPIAFIFGMLARNLILKLFCFAVTLIMFAGIMVTQSRGGFLGILAAAGVVLWKIGRKQRLKVFVFVSVLLFFVMVFAPGNYGIRILSIFYPSLDPVSSSTQRGELLGQSVKVTLRNPTGIGLGNFPVVSSGHLQTHNAYTQVSAELGWLALAAYVIFIVSPLRKLRAVERGSSDDASRAWINYMSIGVQASIVGYMVSSFFGAIAYSWYIYYPIVFAVCLRRMFAASAPEPAVPETGVHPAMPKGELLFERGAL